MALNLSPVNFAGATQPNALAQIGTALGQFPDVAAQAELKKQQVGQQLLQPYLKMLRSNKGLEDNQRFMGTINSIGKQYGIPIPTLQQEEKASETGADTSAAAPSQAPAAAPTPGAPTLPQGGGPPPLPALHPDVATLGKPQSFQFGQLPQMPSMAAYRQGVNPAAPATPAGGSPGAPGQPVAAAVPSAATPPGAQPAAPQGPSPAQQSVAAHEQAAGVHIDPSWVLGELSPDVIAKAQSMDPDQRKQFMALQGIDAKWLPKNFLSAPQQISPAEKAKATDDFAKQIQGVAEGKNTIDSIKAIGNAYRPILGDQVVDSALNDPANLDKMGQGLALQFDRLRQSGYWKDKDYQVAVGKLNAVIQRNGTYAEYVDIQKQLLPHRTGLMDAQAQHAVADAAEAHQRSMTMSSTGGLTRGQIATQYAQALRAYNSLQAQMGRASYYKDPLTGRPEKTQAPDDVIDAAQDAGSDLDYWTDQMHAVGMQVKPRPGYQSSGAPSAYQPTESGPSAAAGSELHKQGVQVAGHKPPPGWKATMQINGKPIGKVGNTWYYEDGTVAR